MPRLLIPRLLIFAKEPQPGRVKTRLAASIGAERAAALAWALLEDTCRLARAAAEAAGARLELHVAPSQPGSALLALAERYGCQVIPQRGQTLGERLAAGLAPEGEARVALGSDAPDLPPALLADAWAGLASADALAAPASDGGYVLLGLGPQAPASALAAPSIRWSSESTLADTRAALAAAGSELGLLSGWRDVDEADDLAALELRLQETPGAAPATRAWLESWRPEGP